MNTLFFKYAIEVEHTGSITQAAENLFMSQPNLSRAIKEMEETLGFAIFERSARGVAPTQKGRAFLEYARKIVWQLNKMEQISDESGNTQRFSISIPRGSYIAEGIINFISGLDMGEEMDINVAETNSMQTVANLESGKFSMGIIRYRTGDEPYYLDYIKEKRLRSDLIWEYDYLAAMSRENCAAQAEVIEAEDLKDCIEIVHGDTAVPYIEPNREFDAEKPLSRKRVYLYERCNQFEILSRIPGSFMLVSPIPGKALEMYGLVQRRCNLQNNRYKDVLLYPEDYSLTPLDRKFIDRLYESRNALCHREYR